jgi:hypothetical protein
MHRSLTTLVAAAVLTATGWPALAPGAAATIGSPSAIRTAVDAITPTERVGCWAYGWRGWGWYPGLLRCAGPVYGPPPVVAAAPIEAPAPVYVEPRRCWVPTDPYGAGYWRRC